MAEVIAASYLTDIKIGVGEWYRLISSDAEAIFDAAVGGSKSSVPTRQNEMRRNLAAKFSVVGPCRQKHERYRQY